jgi:uracil phosphoribosyltransferase
MINVLNRENSVANQFLLELRDKRIQQNRTRFRGNIERLGALMAYEISKTFSHSPKDIQTSLGTSIVNIPTDNPVLITVLRAGLPYFNGFQHIFGEADCGFIGAYRKESEVDLTINLDYLATPSLEGRTLILIDPMLATGQSVIKSANALLKHGVPKHVHIAALVAAPEGIALLQKELAVAYDIWTWALDESLNELHYIVPGLGDAGDLSFGDKL